MPTKMVEKPKGDGKVDIGALWTAPEGDKLQGGRFAVELAKKPLVRQRLRRGCSECRHRRTRVSLRMRELKGSFDAAR